MVAGGVSRLQSCGSRLLGKVTTARGSEVPQCLYSLCRGPRRCRVLSGVRLVRELQPPQTAGTSELSGRPIVLRRLAEAVARLRACQTRRGLPAPAAEPIARSRMKGFLVPAVPQASISPRSLRNRTVCTSSPPARVSACNTMVPLVQSWAAAPTPPALACRAQKAPRSGSRRAGSAVRAAAPAGGSGSGSTPAAAPAVVTDAAVPEGHAGLHGFLYGEGGAEEAHSSERGYTFREVGASALRAAR